MRTCLFLLLSVSSLCATAQYKVRIIVTGKPAMHASDPVFFTGNVNRWKPGDSLSMLKDNENHQLEIVLTNQRPGLMEYKFTRGDWKTLESTKEGHLVAPRKAVLHSDTTLYAVIEGWRDDFPASTASPHVHLLRDSFYIPQLQVHRSIWIYLPADYHISEKRYPVLYMHDGQDVFDEATSAGRIGPLEWGVDETIDASPHPCIVVAVAHAEDKRQRIREYHVHDNPETTETQGSAYLKFITETLKPFIDSCFRTQPGKATTFMAGSSMGGLLSFYAGILYPHIFGTIAVLSPSIWLDHGHIETALATLKPDTAIRAQRYFFYAGGKENRLKPDSTYVRMHDDVSRVVKIFEQTGTEIKTSYNPEGRHGAWYWRSAFAIFYQWLFPIHTNKP